MKMLKQILLFSVLLFMTGFTMAQNNTQDVVYLKNGGIMRGTLIELVPDSLLKIQTADGNVFVYQMSEIKKYTKEPNLNAVISPPKDTTGIKHGYYGVVEYGSGMTFGEIGGPLTTKINIVNGYRVCPWFAAGVGVGVRAYIQDGIYLPVYADLRVNFFNRKTSPYIALDGGYGFRTTHNKLGGIMFSPTFGVFVKIKDRFALNIGLNYELQASSNVIYPYNCDNSYTRRNANSHTFGFLFGFVF
jgi:hypothetical protein